MPTDIKNFLTLGGTFSFYPTNNIRHKISYKKINKTRYLELTHQMATKMPLEFTSYVN